MILCELLIIIMPLYAFLHHQCGTIILVLVYEDLTTNAMGLGARGGD